MYCRELLFFLMPLTSFLSLSQSDSDKFLDCSMISISCGLSSFNISYPFRVPGMPEYCGHPKFEVQCIKNSALDINIAETKYRVSAIRYDIQFVSVANLEYVLADSCPRKYSNTLLDSSLYDYFSNVINLTLFFNCSRLSQAPHPNITNIPCLSNVSMGSNWYESFYSLPNNNPPPLMVTELYKKCSSIVLIPMHQNNEDFLLHGRLDFLGVLQDGFWLNWIVGNGWCNHCEASGGVCGNDPNAPNAPTCFCRDATTTNAICPGDGRKSRKKTIAIGSVAVVGFVMVCLLLSLYFYRRRKVSLSVIFWRRNLNNNRKIKALLETYGSVTPKRYSYSNVKRITKAFQVKLGQGCYGTVYNCTLGNGHVVAVKILKDSKGDGEEFINEVASICRTSHVNVVSLLGFCHEGSKRALIYDFMYNGSLEKLLYSEKPKITCDWQKLYKIAIGIALGLEYLHRGCNTHIVHFDIKPHNILLDQDFCPKILDFGLAKLCLKNKSIISIAGARGTICYIAPEVFSRNFGVVSSKSDVYSYGMMVLEIVRGRKNPSEGVKDGSEAYFPHWIYAQLSQNGNLLTFGATTENECTVRKLVLVGLWCIQTMPENRPSMSRVIEMIEGRVDDLEILPKPYLSSSPFGSIISTSTVQDICWINCSSSVGP